jgi:hypothetical protein
LKKGVVSITYIREPIVLETEGITEVHITKKGIYKYGGKGKKLVGRVLAPEEFVAIRRVVEKMYESDKKNSDDELTNLDCLLLLGARYVECQRIQRHPEWFQNEFVVIDNTKPKAIEASGSRRHIRLSNKGKTLMRYFFKVDKRLPTIQAYDQKLKRWAKLANVSPSHLSVRVLRKTWESWLNVCYPQYGMMIAKSQGHTVETAMKYYVEMPFTNKDIADMKDWVEGWKPADKGW